MVYYKPLQTTIDAPGLAEIFIDLTVWHDLPQPLWLNCTSRLNCHLKVLVFSMLLPRRQATTIQSLSSTGFRRYYAISRYRYRLMHPGFLTWLSMTETQSSPSSFGPRGITFRRGYGYTPLSSTAVIAHASPTKNTLAPVSDSIRNLITTCRKNLPHGLDIANPFPSDF